MQWILNPNTRLVLDYVDSKFTGGVARYTKSNNNATATADDERALTARAQFDF